MEQYIWIVTCILGGILGLCVGSFLNVVIYRVPEKMNLANPPSHCPRCGYRLKWYDNIPVLSYTLLKGKCRSCRAPISFRYTAVEIANTVLWLASILLFWRVSIPYACMCAAASSVMLCIFFIDFEHLIIPDRFQIMLGVLGIAAVFLDPYRDWLSHLIGMGAAGIVFFGVAFIGEKVMGREALGGGDVKLAIVTGLFLGWEKFLIAMLLASLSGSIILMVMRYRKHQERDTEYPFGPFITAGVTVAMLFGNLILSGYESILYSIV